jgi:hypothetical protein
MKEAVDFRTWEGKREIFLHPTESGLTGSGMTSNMAGWAASISRF